MKAQKEGDFNAADLGYKELFKIPVLVDDGNVQSSPAVRNIRYLAFRNHGLLQFKKLAQRHKEMEVGEILNQLLESMSDLLEALQHTESDVPIVKLLLSIFDLFESKRLFRFVLEYELTKDENDDVILFARKKPLNQLYLSFLKRDKLLLEQMGDSFSLKTRDYPPMIDQIEPVELENLDIFKPALAYIEEKSKELNQHLKLEILLYRTTWKEVSMKLTQNLSKITTRTSKFKNLYQFLDSPVEDIKFNIYDPTTKLVIIEKSEATTPVPSKVSSSVEPADQTPVIKDTEAEGQSKSETKADGQPNIKTEPNDQPIQIEAEAQTQPEAQKKESKNEEKPDVEMKEETDQKRLASSTSDLEPTQRSSKRFRQGSADSSTAIETFKANLQFMNTLNLYLEPMNISLNSTLDDIINSDANNYINDFYSSLSNWSPKLNESLFHNLKNSAQAINVTEIVSLNTFAEDQLDLANGEELDDQLAEAFLHKVNSKKTHFLEAIHLFVTTLLNKNYETNVCYILDCHMDNDAYKHVETLTYTIESTLFDQFQDEEFLKKHIATAVAVLEVSINSFIKLSQGSKMKSISTKSLYEINSSMYILQPKVDRWKKLVGHYLLNNKTLDDFSLLLRFKWAVALYYQNQQNPLNDQVQDLLAEFYNEIKINHGNINLKYHNYEAIPSLNLTNIKTQIDKINVLTTFEKTFNSNDTKSDDTFAILELVLLPHNPEDLTDEQLSMDQFIKESSLFSKLKLWSILLQNYLKSEDLSKYETALTLALSFTMEQLSSESFTSHPEATRQQLIATIIGFNSEFIQGFLTLLENINWNISLKNEQLFKLMVSFFQLLYCYILHETYCQKNNLKTFHENAAKSSSKIRDVISQTLSLVFILYKSSSDSQERTLDLLSILHEQMGIFQFCAANSGYFLRLSDTLLSDIDSETFEADIIQHLNCRFHVVVPSEKYTPVNHFTKKQELTRESALVFSKALFKILQRKKNPLFSPCKLDMKTTLDLFYLAIGDPDYNKSILQKNLQSVETYFNSPLDFRTLVTAASGQLTIFTRKTDLVEQTIVEKGLYYLEATTNYNFFKSRRKMMQAKLADLDVVHKMVRSDLSYGTNRVESWILLGEIYSIQVEDDLIWTSDKLNSIEKKKLTANTQRKAILAYLMALSIVINDPALFDSMDKQTLILLFGKLSFELYHSVSIPLNGLCYQDDLNKKVLAENGLIMKPVTVSEFKNQTSILKIVKNLLKFAIKRVGSEEWKFYYYLAKTYHKLKYAPTKVIEECLKSCKFNSSGLEPHYLLCSLLYKYCKLGYFTEQEVAGFFASDKEFLGDVEHVDGKTGYQYLILGALKNMIAWDKKKWHHKPKYRAAMIYFELGEFAKAYKEFESLIVIKAQNKNLISIWKPENERAGKHFVYTFTYVNFAIRLYNALADLQTLLLFTRKLRRFGPGMINIMESWELSCLSTCIMTKEYFEIEAGFTDKYVAKLVHYQFVVLAKHLIEMLCKGAQINEEDLEILLVLYEIYEIRRINNGFGSTSQIDDTFNSLYLKLYFKYITPETEAKIIEENNLNNNFAQDKKPTKIKVARKEVLAEAISVVKAIDGKLKSKYITEDVKVLHPSQEMISKHQTVSAQNIQNRLLRNDQTGLLVEELVSSNFTYTAPPAPQQLLNGSNGDAKEETPPTANSTSGLNTPVKQLKAKEQASSDVDDFQTPAGESPMEDIKVNGNEINNTPTKIA